ncbi:MAG TPA: SIMPL domain-containing protein [Acidobacteriaceae bacterium]|nr:SIMPL domain-containing protein [Acidobacteriaceae bacterium]
MAQYESSPLLIPFTALGVLLAIGLVVGGLLLGTRIRDFKRADRYVEVKGLVERTVKSDSATWPISFSEAGDSLPTVFAASEKDKAAVIAFLQAQGFSPADVTLGSISVTDRSTQQFNNNNHGPRFVVDQTITVQSNDVDKVAAANSHTADLIRAGIVIQSGGNGIGGGGGGVIYKFNGLNALKPDMITEATRNARASADRFAADSGSQVGAIRSAEQGVFSISAANAGSSTGDDGGFDQQADSSIMKKVRVVSTIDYYLVN